MITPALLLLSFIAGSGANFTCNSTNSQDCSCVAISGPEDTIALAGTDIILNCYVTRTEDDEVQWMQGTTGLGTDPDITCCDRYSMNNLQQNYSLVISNVTVLDQDDYKCQVDKCAPTKYSNTATLQVYVLPTGPVIENNIEGYVHVLANEPSELTCDAYNAKPQATVRWYNSNTGAFLDSVVMNSIGTDETNNTKTIYDFTPTAMDNGTVYECEVSSPATDMSTDSFEKKIKLYVIAKPVVFTTGIPSGGELVINEDQSQQITCLATSTTSNAQIVWFRDDIRQDTDTKFTEGSGDYNVSNTIAIEGSEANEGVTYTCVVTVPGFSIVYNETLAFTVSIYAFPYALVIGCSVSGFLLLLLFIILITVCVKNSRKKKKAEREEKVKREIQNVIANAHADKEQVEEEVVVVRATADVEQALKNDPGYNTDSETYKPSDEYFSSSDDESQSYRSVDLPSGDTFSLSSSMIRSDRGSPVIMYSDLDNNSTYSSDGEPTAIPSRTGSVPPVYYTRETGTVMLTDV